MGFFTGLFDKEIVLSEIVSDEDRAEKASAALEKMGFKKCKVDDSLAMALDIVVVVYSRENDRAELRFDNNEGISLVAPRRVVREFMDLQSELQSNKAGRI